jgi:hypothetical protein
MPSKQAQGALPERLKVKVSILIALTTVLGAGAAWRSTIASEKAEDAEREGFANVAAREQARSEIGSSLNASLFYFLTTKSYEAQAEQLKRESGRAASDDAARLADQAKAYKGLADVSVAAVENALSPDGSLDLGRQFDIEMSQAERERDLDPGPEFAEADDLNTKSQRLVGISAFLIAGALFFTFAQVARRGQPRLYLAGGLMVLVAATSLLVLVEMT